MEARIEKIIRESINEINKLIRGLEKHREKMYKLLPPKTKD